MIKRFVLKLPPSTLAAIFLSIIALVFSAQARAAERIDILNPGFEVAGDDGVADWLFTTDPAHTASANGVATVAQLTHDRENAKEGSASAKIHHEGPRWASLRQRVSLEAGATYRLKVYVRSENAGVEQVRIVARLSNRDKRENVIAPPEGIVFLDSSGEWQEISHEFKIPDRVSSGDKVWLELKAILNDPAKGAADIWFDDVSLERIDEN
jgi:hypothetical protein